MSGVLDLDSFGWLIFMLLLLVQLHFVATLHSCLLMCFVQCDFCFDLFFSFSFRFKNIF